MSNVCALVARVNEVRPHPNADRLDIVQVLGAQVVVPRGDYCVAQQVVYFPPDLLLPGKIAGPLGVTKYLKHAVYPGDTEKTQCRVAACRLRGEPSYGFIAPCPAGLQHLDFGADVSGHYLAKKYEPPPRPRISGDVAPDLVNFPQYTNIQHYWRYPDAIPEGTYVRVTEKIHGTNCRIGMVFTGETWELAAGSHRVRLKRDDNNIYWEPANRPSVIALLDALNQSKHNVVIYGEIYGPGVQDMDYGVPNGKRDFRVFDILVDGKFLNWGDVEFYCQMFGVSTVPVLWIDEFYQSDVPKFTNGYTTLNPAKIKSRFKGREGIVVTPLMEDFSPVLGGRMILKSVSADYLDRKGGTDLA